MKVRRNKRKILLRVFVFPGPRPSARSPGLAPNLYLPTLAPNLYLPALAPNFYLPAQASPEPELCIYQPCSPNGHLLVLAYNLYYRSGL